MHKFAFFLGLLLGANSVYPNFTCGPLIKIYAKKLHPDLALGPVASCDTLPLNNDKKLLAFLYFSDTEKQDIFEPTYDLDVLLINEKTNSVLAHLHEKEFLKEIGVDLALVNDGLSHISQNYRSTDKYTENLSIFTKRYNVFKLNDSVETFSLTLRRRNNSYNFEYQEEILYSYYVLNDTLNKIFGNFRLYLKEREVNLAKQLSIQRESQCSIKTDNKNKTHGFNDLIVQNKKKITTYSFNKARTRLEYLNEKEKRSQYTLKYDGHGYKIPEQCKVQLNNST